MRRPSLIQWCACVVVVVVFGVVSVAGAAANEGHRGFFFHQPGYTVTPLVSDQPGVAPVTDPNLVNAWGLVAGPATPWWVANNGSETSTLYDGLGNRFPPPPTGPLVVAVPGAPTGTVFNGGVNFQVSNGTTDVASKFIFATESGTILGWPGGVTAAVQAVRQLAAGAVYKGLAIDGDMLYATDFQNGRVDVFDGSWKPDLHRWRVRDPFLPHGYGRRSESSRSTATSSSPSRSSKPAATTRSQGPGSASSTSSRRAACVEHRVGTLRRVERPVGHRDDADGRIWNTRARAARRQLRRWAHQQVRPAAVRLLVPARPAPRRRSSTARDRRALGDAASGMACSTHPPRRSTSQPDRLTSSTGCSERSPRIPDVAPCCC